MNRGNQPPLHIQHIHPYNNMCPLTPFPAHIALAFLSTHTIVFIVGQSLVVAVNLYFEIYHSSLGEIVGWIYLLTARTRWNKHYGMLLAVEGTREITIYPLLLANMQTYELGFNLVVGGIGHIKVFRRKIHLARLAHHILPKLVEILGHGSDGANILGEYATFTRSR